MGRSTTERKGWFRLRSIALAMALLVICLLGWASLEVIRLHNAEPVMAVNYRQQFRQKSMQLANVTAEDGAQSWAIVRLALQEVADVEIELWRPRSAEFVPRFSWDKGEVSFEYVSTGETLPTDIAAEREALRVLRERGFFDALQRLEHAPGLSPVDFGGPSMFMETPEALQARSVARALAASMRVDAVAGNIDRAIRDFSAGLALTRTLSLQPGMVSAVAAVSLEMLMLKEARWLLAEHEFTVDQCRAMLAALEQHQTAGLLYALEAQRTEFHNLVQHLFSDDGDGNGYLMPRAVKTLNMASGGGGTVGAPRGASVFSCIGTRFYFSDRRETLRLFDQFIDAMQVEAALPLVDRWKRGFDGKKFADGLSHRQKLVALMTRPVNKAITAWDTRDTEREATRIAIALETARSVHGRFPETLAELAPEIVPATPNDPLNGQPWGYRVLHNDEFARPYLLYSWSINGRDDGGTPDFGSGRPTQHEPDMVINNPRERWGP